MEFQDFINKIGVQKLSVMLQCTEATIYKWRSAESAPRPETAYVLTILSHGELTLQNIFMPYIERSLKGTSLNIPDTNGKNVTTLEFNF